MQVKIVTTKVARHCFYSGYPEGSPEMIFKPGMLGILNGSRAPIHMTGESEIVDFWDGEREWRVAYHKKHLRLIETLEAELLEEVRGKKVYGLMFQGVLWKAWQYPNGKLGSFHVATYDTPYPIF